MVNGVPWDRPMHSIHRDTPSAFPNKVPLFVSPEEIFHDLRKNPMGLQKILPMHPEVTLLSFCKSCIWIIFLFFFVEGPL